MFLFGCLFVLCVCEGVCGFVLFLVFERGFCFCLFGFCFVLQLMNYSLRSSLFSFGMPFLNLCLVECILLIKCFFSV